MPEPEPYAGWSLTDRLQMLAFEARLANLPPALIVVIWEAIGSHELASSSATTRVELKHELTKE